MRETPVNPPVEWEDAVRRVLGSGVFQKSPKLREFLTYSAAQSLKGERELLSEQQIGIAVFGRTPGYNPSDDSIVRVQAHNLREKLAEYFEGEGVDDGIVITVPKGSYGLAFTTRALPGDGVLGAPPGTESEPAASTGRQERPRLRWRIAAVALVIAAFSLGALVHSFWAPGDRAQKASGGGSADKAVANPILRSVFAPPTQTVVIFEDSLLVVASLARGSAYSLNEFIALEGNAPNFGRAAGGADGGGIERALRNARHLQFADVPFVVRLLRFYPHLAESTLFKHPREVQLREVKSSSCVLFGGQLSNPWFDLYEPSLNFHLRTSREGANFENRRPQAGESGSYGLELGKVGPTYARVALLPNFQANTRVLMLTGVGSPETEAAAEFVLDPNLLDHVPAGLREHLRTAPEHLEILLGITRVGRVAGSVQVVAWRIQREGV